MRNTQHNAVADKLITVDDIMAHEPCDYYPEARVRELIGEGKTVLEILELPIPAEDRLWVFIRTSLLPDDVLHEFALRCAEAVLPVWEKRYPEDDRPRKAIETKRRWMRGDATDDELFDAAAAAYDAEYACEYGSDEAYAAKAVLRSAIHGGRAAISVSIYMERAAESVHDAHIMQLHILREILTGGQDEEHTA